MTVYPCGHFVHNRCDKGLRNSNCKTKHNCPICRKKLPRIAEQQEEEISSILLELSVPDVNVFLEGISFLLAGNNFIAFR